MSNIHPGNDINYNIQTDEPAYSHQKQNINFRKEHSLFLS